MKDQFLILASLSLSIFLAIQFYLNQKKISELKHNLEAMTRRFNISRSSEHTSYALMDSQNEALRAQVKILKSQMLENGGEYWAKMYHELLKETLSKQESQNESSVYRSHSWAKDIYGDKPYVNPWNNTHPKE